MHNSYRPNRVNDPHGILPPDAETYLQEGTRPPPRTIITDANGTTPRQPAEPGSKMSLRGWLVTGAVVVVITVLFHVI